MGDFDAEALIKAEEMISGVHACYSQIQYYDEKTSPFIYTETLSRLKKISKLSFG
ncbi:hypothetical protein Xhom_03102 [Xenorhabdus hominickii]|uniref:Uncharacterized protein n=1 Tax=Xenorhabdus hominickii TaxID=351679 RepID=A0A2G0Q4A5_XENHO|nr:hypothetical protein Xhom_03102 [Xenorhabdus hominickii]